MVTLMIVQNFQIHFEIAQDGTRRGKTDSGEREREREREKERENLSTQGQLRNSTADAAASD